MIIAIATEKGKVAGHFGHCREFTFIEFHGKEVTGKTVLQSPEHRRGFFPRFVSGHDAEYIIAGGIGRRACELFRELNIKTICGITGEVDEVARKLIRGELEPGESQCDHDSGRHGHGCQDH